MYILTVLYSLLWQTLLIWYSIMVGLTIKYLQKLETLSSKHYLAKENVIKSTILLFFEPRLYFVHLLAEGASLL